MDFKTILEGLNALPIFKMSLGSKELFHSNFLEYLWSLDKKRFINLINDLFGGEVLAEDANNYELSREKENFDICIYHNEGKKFIYDVIIENKVKSIPNKKQLDGYVEKVKNHKQGQKANYLLLSLITDFPDKDDIINDNVWTIVNYRNLHYAISKCYAELEDKNSVYIKDYLKFAELMQELEKAIVPENFTDETLWPAYECYKQYRLHDLYIKLRGLKFMYMLKDKLEKANITSDIIPIGGYKLREYYNTLCDEDKKGVYLNWNVFNAVGQIAAFIHNGSNEIYEIVIQGDQYRHGINYYDENDSNLKSLINSKSDKAIEEIWSRVCENDFIKNYYWGRKSEALNTEYKKQKTYCQYKPDYVYRYLNISQLKISTLLDRMVEDIKHTIENTTNTTN